MNTIDHDPPILGRFFRRQCAGWCRQIQIVLFPPVRTGPVTFARQRNFFLRLSQKNAGRIAGTRTGSGTRPRAGRAGHSRPRGPALPPPARVPAPAPAPGVAASRGPAGQPLPASSQAIAANATASEVAGQLTMELRRYVAYTRSIPKNFEDFTAHDPIKFPPPPPGKRYVITGGQVVLQ